MDLLETRQESLESLQRQASSTRKEITRPRMPYKGKRRPRWLDLLGLSHTKEHAVKWRLQALACICLSGIVLYTLFKDIFYQDAYSLERRSASRHLLSNVSHLPEWEQCDFEKGTSPEAWIFNHAVCILIIFLALAIVCDDFFVPSLEVISEKLHLSEDVAGATFMAAGSSAPELFTSVAGVAVQTDVGVGTIVGSAVFNLLIIIALTAALAGQVLHLDWRPLIRDSFFYALSIACFILFAWDGKFEHYEAAILLALYIVYILLMVINPRLMDWMGSWRCICKARSITPGDEDVEGSPDPNTQDTTINNSSTKLKDQANNVNHTTAPNKPADGRRLSLTGGHARRISLIQRSHSGEIDKDRFFHHKRGSVVGVLGSVSTRKMSHIPMDAAIQEEDEMAQKEDSVEKKDKEGESENEEEEEDEEAMQLCPCLPCCCPIRTSPPSSVEAREEGGCLNWFKLCLRWILFVPAFPFVCLFSWTIPDCSKSHNKKLYLLSFFMSVAWIAALSFGMVTLVGRTGCILNVDSYIMGLVVVAIGTSIPDALSSILVARDGFGDMAVSNAIGSNVFDINLGLGLPFIIRIAIDKGAAIHLLDAAQELEKESGHMTIIPHAKFGFLLLLILLIAMVIFLAARFRLNKAIGISFVIMYILFLAYAFTQEIYCVRTLGIYC